MGLKPLEMGFIFQNSRMTVIAYNVSDGEQTDPAGYIGLPITR